jgi:hexosaminidase
VRGAKLRLVIDESRTSPALSSFGVFKAPPRVIVEPDGGGFEDSVTVRLTPDVQGVPVYYTLDGTTPTLRSLRYTSPIVLTHTTSVVALAAVNGEMCVETSEARFTQGRKVTAITLENRSSPRYPGHGSSTLTDGLRGSTEFEDEKWLGFEGDDLIATLDLGKSRPITSVTAGFLQRQGSWIFLPSHVTFSVSVDSRRWTRLTEVTYPVRQTEEVLVRDCTCAAGQVGARYVRVVAQNAGTCPPWHPGAGGKAWLFVDEIIVN